MTKKLREWKEGNKKGGKGKIGKRFLKIVC